MLNVSFCKDRTCIYFRNSPFERKKSFCWIAHRAPRFMDDCPLNNFEVFSALCEHHVELIEQQAGLECLHPHGLFFMCIEKGCPLFCKGDANEADIEQLSDI